MVLEITFWAHPELCWDEECGPSSRRLVWREKPPTPPGSDLTHHLLGFWVGGPGARGWELWAESGFSPWSRVGQVRFGNIPQLWFFKKIAQCSSPRFPGTRSVAEEWVKSEATFTLEKPMWIRRREVYLGFKFVRNAWLCKSADIAVDVGDHKISLCENLYNRTLPTSPRDFSPLGFGLVFVSVSHLLHQWIKFRFGPYYSIHRFWVFYKVNYAYDSVYTRCTYTNNFLKNQVSQSLWLQIIINDWAYQILFEYTCKSFTRWVWYFVNWLIIIWAGSTKV